MEINGLKKTTFLSYPSNLTPANQSTISPPNKIVHFIIAAKLIPNRTPMTLAGSLPNIINPNQNLKNSKPLGSSRPLHGRSPPSCAAFPKLFVGYSSEPLERTSDDKPGCTQEKADRTYTAPRRR